MSEGEAAARGFVTFLRAADLAERAVQPVAVTVGLEPVDRRAGLPPAQAATWVPLAPPPDCQKEGQAPLVRRACPEFARSSRWCRTASWTMPAT